MKKKQRRLEYEARSVSLDLDDLSQIVSIMSEACQKVSISDEDHEFQNLEELRDLRGPQISQINIDGSFPFIHFYSKPSTRLSGDSDSSAAFYEIRSILEQRKRRWLNAILHPWSLILTSGLLVLLFLWTNRVFNFPNWLGIPILAFFVGYCILVMTVGMKSWFGGYSQLLLVRKHERESFWRKNKDAIVIAIITNLLTALGTFLVTYLSFRQGIK